MANFNKVLLIGNLTKDPELRYTPQGTAVVNLRLAVNRRFRDKAGEQKEEVCYVTVVVWDKQAETCNQFLRRGNPVFVEGRLQSRSWEDNAGQKRNVLEVRAERIQFLGPAQKATAEPEIQEEPRTEEVYPANSWLNESEERVDDDIKE
ncbi:MAG: single-stranded DNA-binding protein [Candidatus Omnitrophica bacterium]|nr:single-stranded DNA-binding protein [Candidatus Omnitrophota bacterium]